MYSILTQIQNAIQENDHRDVHQTLDLTVHSDTDYCNVIYEEPFEEQLRLANRMHSVFPIVAQYNIERLGDTLPTSPDFVFIREEVCNFNGVRNLRIRINMLIARYALAFTQLESFRDTLARVNDVFAGEVGEIARHLKERSVMKLEEAKTIYANAKESIERTINNFLTRVHNLHTEIRRLLQEFHGRRVGWGYKVNNPSSHFLIILRQRPLSLNQPTESDISIPNIWLPENSWRPTQTPPATTRRPRPTPRQPGREARHKEIDNYSCIQNIASLDELAHAIETKNNLTLQIYAFQEDSNILKIQLTHLTNVFGAWMNTCRGWFPTPFFIERLYEVQTLFHNFEYQILRNVSCSTIPSKKKVINNFIYDVLNPSMTFELKWYWHPQETINKVKNFIVDSTEKLKMEAPSSDLKINFN